MKNSLYNKILAFGIATIFACSLNTEGQDSTNIEYDNAGNIKRIRFEENSKTGEWNSPTSPETFFSETLGLHTNNEFVFKYKLTETDRTFSEIYKQFYKGVKVEKSIYVLDFKDGKLIKANGHFVNISDLDTTPKITPEEASRSYAEYLGITNTEGLQFISGISISQIEVSTDGDTAYPPKLCYKINLLNIPSGNGETGFIDAQTGKVYKSVRMWDDDATAATFATLYSGNKTANTEYYNSQYNLADFSRDATIHTWDLNNTPYGNYAANQVEFTNSNTSWTNEQMALDIHWALQEVYDYFYDNHNGFESFDGADRDIEAYAHATFTGGDKDGAKHVVFANDDELFFFGEGDEIGDPWASLDVVAHEYAHAITVNHTSLDSDGDEGAMREGFSDIWAVIIEENIAPEKDSWKIGEEVIIVSNKNCLRNIMDPDSYYALYKISDTYEGDYWDDGKHAQGGIFSHWFYLLTEGGSGTNDNNDAYNVYGLGMDDAADIVFRGHTSEFSNVSTFSGARDAMVYASDHFFGTNSIQSLQVKNAWYAVGVGSNPGQVTITPPSNNLVCSSGGTFTVNNVPSGHTVSWNYSAALTLVSASGNNATFNTGSTTSSSAWVKVTINNVSDGTSVTLPQFDTWCGTPQVTNKKVDGSSYYPGFQVCPGDHYLSGTPTGGDAGTATWTVPYGIVYFVGTNTLDFTFPSSASGIAFTARCANTCGTGPTTSFYVTKKSWGCSKSYGMIVLSPNPASDEVTITINDDLPLTEYAVSGNTIVDVDAKTDEPTYSISIYNNQGTKLFSATRSGKSFTIPLNKIPDGTYIVEVNDKKNSYHETLIVKRK